MKIAIPLLSLAAFLASDLGGLAQGAENAHDTSFLVGACTHFSQNKGDLPANLIALRQAGLRSIRDEAGWAAVEREKGRLVMPRHYDAYVRAARSAGIEPLLIFDYANPHYDDGDRPRSTEAVAGFCRYAEFLVRHFGQDVRLYEVWNEWDIGIGLPQRHRQGGSAVDYVRLLKAVYPRVKEVDPGITVMAGACTSGGVEKGWLEEILKLGALDLCDAISIHSYNYSAPFPERSPESCSVWMTGVHEMLQRHNDGQPVPFYVTEMGWPTHRGKTGTAPELAASYLARLYLLARISPSFRGLWWYDFQDDGWDAEDNENNFGLVRPDLTPKPAFFVLAHISDLVAHSRFLGRHPTADEALWILRFSHRGQDVWAVWCGDDQDRQVILKASRPHAPITLQPLGQATLDRQWGQRLWAEGRDRETRPDIISFVAGPRPILLSGELDDVSVESISNRN